ncbi:flippase-like domain-containing protein [Halorubrum sp. JWXQ-INN 858]|uniref:flippase-like domain-containing protein n=1 Tax=Halorubrum sp. JWXQ-INN 858 TaxID=2690782 RepID=UPI00135C5860|nr:flippase-like domain-containing protein [Halorubrum sp. JWXQ-INN 858]MWV65603.1 flippase-like domain-containing protein [Halorubrum sp. JWXQ-INN 858]
MSGSSGEPSVSVVLPAYNEERTIEGTVRTTLTTLGSFLPEGSFEVIVAEDGCDDRTPEIASRMAAEDDRVRHVHSDERLGRGGALEHAFAAATGRTLVYFDTDLATDMRHLEELVTAVESGAYDVATGSRWMPGRTADRPAKRGIPSKGFNLLVRLFLRSDLRDHQCGFKALSREAFETLRDDVEDTHWFWDTELLVRAQRRGLAVTEFPVDWEPMGDTKVDLVRDVLGMGSAIVRLWWELSVQPRITRRVTFAAGLLLVLAAVALMQVYLDPAAVIAEMRNADLGLVAVATGLYVVSWPIRGYRYRDILRELGFEERVGFLTGAIFVSQTGNLVFPARAGDAVRAYIVKMRRGIPYPSGFASLAAERVFDLLTLAGLAGVVLVGYAASGELAAVVDAALGTGVEADRAGRTAVAVAVAVGFAAVAAVLAIVLSARSDANRVRALVTWMSSDSYGDYVASVVERFVGDVQRVGADPSAFARVGATSVLIWVIDVLVAAVVLAAFGVGLAPVTLLAACFFAVSVGNLAKVLPLSPGGIGLYEGAFTVLIVGLTPVGAATALGAAIVDHAVKNVVTVLGGVASMLALNVSLTTAVEETEGVSEGTDAVDPEAVHE